MKVHGFWFLVIAMLALMALQACDATIKETKTSKVVSSTDKKLVVEEGTEREITQLHWCESGAPEFENGSLIIVRYQEDDTVDCVHYKSARIVKDAPAREQSSETDGSGGAITLQGGNAVGTANTNGGTLEINTRDCDKQEIKTAECREEDSK